MEKFVMKNDNLVNVCREVKEFLNKQAKEYGYAEITIMYSVSDQKFFTAYTGDADKLVYEGNVYYETVNMCHDDKRKTIKSLKWDIFKK